MTYEPIKHRLNLPFRGMCPYGTGDEEVEFFIEEREIKIWIVAEPGSLRVSNAGFQKYFAPGIEHFTVGFDATITIFVQEMDEPIANAQATTSDVQDLRVGHQALT
jgi:hypothetical protein